MRQVRQVRFAAVSMLGLVLTLAAASPAFAGISDFSITRNATLAPGGLQVSVSGTVMCPVGETVSITLQVSQFEHGQLVATAFGSTSFPFGIACNGAVETWTLTASASFSATPMHAGPASASASAFAGFFFPPETAQTTAELLLQETH